MNKLIRPTKISLKSHPTIKESWIQEQIANDPSILELGDLVLKDKERMQPRAGRLDLLLQDAETKRRYEVEIQLGKTDESHIIRTIEYWDIERKRYPQYDHCAVIIAEEITSRFLNVISLFNGNIPLIAIQLNAYLIDDQIALFFTKVLDELPLGLVDEDEEIREVTDREFWIKKGSLDTVSMADELLELIRSFAPHIHFKYNKFYIGLSEEGQPSNFCVFRPRKRDLNLDIKLQYSEEVQQIIETESLDDMGYDKRWGNFRLRLTKQDLKNKKHVIKSLMEMAFNEFK